MPSTPSVTPQRSAYTGWWAAAFVLLAVFVGAGVVWFMFHP